LTTAAVVLLYLPIRSALHQPVGVDPVGDGFSIPTEFFWILAFVGSAHLLFFVALIEFAVDEESRRRVMTLQKKGTQHEVSSNH
jgi:hypothetical protein